MNTLKTLTILLFSILSYSKSFASDACIPCTYIYTSGVGNFNLGTNELLCIQAGVLTGNVNINGNNVVICISDGATYAPDNFNFIHGLKIVNRGTLIINGANVNHKGYIDNHGIVEVRGNLNFNNDLEVKNWGTWINVSNFEFKRNSLFINEGYVECRAEFSSEPNTSFINNGRMKIVGNFNPNGEFFNNGPLVTSGFVNINSQARLTNQCFLYATLGFNNNSAHTQNMGLIQTAPGMPVQLNSQYWQNANGTLRGGSLINNAVVTGDGYYYFTGNTVNHSQFGNGNSNIQFHDVSNNGNAFDTENGFSNIVSHQEFVPMDTMTAKQVICPGLAEILPVELVSFSASRQGMLIEIVWETATEFNSSHFIVERSYDAINFEEIGRVDGAGTTSVPHNYHILDLESVESLEAVAYYRLRQVDFDDRFEVFQIVAVDLGEVGDFESPIKFFPNPTTGILYVSSDKEKILYSLDGKFVLRTRELFIDMSEMETGMYLLSLDGRIEKVFKK